MYPAVLALLVATIVYYGMATPVIKEGGEIIVSPGDRVTLTCSGNQTVKWDIRKSTKWIVKQSETSSVLEIKSATYKETKSYKCVYNDTRYSGMASVHLYVKDTSYSWSTFSGTVVKMEEGKDVVLPCLITDPSIPRANIQLESSSLNSANISFDYHKGFTIHGVQMENDGMYICKATVNGHVRKSLEMRLFVIEVPRLPPNVTMEPQNDIRIKGEAFKITCKATGKVLPVLRWETPATDYTVTNTTRLTLMDWTTTSTLYIHKVNFTDSGNYTCIGYYPSYASRLKRISMSLHVIEEGYVRLTTLGNNRITLRAGESTNITILIDAYPSQLSWAWIHENHGNQSNVSSQAVVKPDGHYRNVTILQLNRILEYEEGSYTFTAQNARANASLAFKIVLNRPPVVNKMWSINNTYTCTASGYPLPKIEWSKCSENKICHENIKQPMTNYNIIVESHLTVTQNITSIVCKAFNSVGEDSREMELPRTFETSRPDQEKLFTPIVISSLILAGIFIVLSAFLYYKYQQKPKYEIRWQIIQPAEGNNYTCIDPTQLPYNDKWEFPRTNLQFGKTLGAGAFGKVMEATAVGLGNEDSAVTVAVKMLKPSAHTDEVEALMSELKILSHLGNHKNIVNLLGACTHGGPILVITEYCHYGDLLNFLRKKAQIMNEMFSASLEEQSSTSSDYKNMTIEHKYIKSDSGFLSKGTDSYVEMKPVSSLSSQGDSLIDEKDTDDMLPLDLYDLLSFSFQVSQGMSFLSAKNCIHRDVAARNVLVSHGRVVKICDFGLARDIENDSNYVVKGNARLPVKWMAPESIFDCVYTVQSDVWSYGILLWEMFSLGRSPYPGIMVNRKFYKMIKEGYKMDCPDYAPLEIYRIMKTCWDLEPTQRPTFNQISTLISKQINILNNQDYANISEDQQVQECMENKRESQPHFKGNNYQFC